MFFTVLFTVALLVVAVCIVQAVLSRAHRMPPDLLSPFGSPVLFSAAVSPLLASVPAAVSPMLLFQPMSPLLAALVPEAISPPSPLFKAVPPPPPPPAVDDEFVGLFVQMNITPPGQQVHRQTTEMWHVPARPPPQEDMFPELTEEGEGSLAFAPSCIRYSSVAATGATTVAVTCVTMPSPTTSSGNTTAKSLKKEKPQKHSRKAKNKKIIPLEKTQKQKKRSLSLDNQCLSLFIFY